MNALHATKPSARHGSPRRRLAAWALGAGALALLVAASLGIWFAPAAARIRYLVTDPSPKTTVDIDEPAKPGLPGEAPPSKTLQDTLWIADWTFDGAMCNSTGWTVVDNRDLNDGSNYWSIDNSFNGTGGITGRAAILAKHDLCWARDGFGNAWDYSIVLKYGGSVATLDFDILSDGDPGRDFVSVEADSLGLSESLVNYAVNPRRTPESFRDVLFTNSGPDLGSHIGPVPLPDLGPGTHEVYVRFESSDEGSDEDGDYPSIWNAGLIVDNVAVTGTIAYSENFEGGLNANVSLQNTAPALPFGTWARLFSHITDNDKLTENTTCAWLFSDPTRIAFQPNMAFGPAQAVVRNWLDNIVISPWVSLASTPSADGTVLSYRTFPGNDFATGRIVQSWRVRARTRVDNTDSATPGDSIDCTTPWMLIDDTYQTLSSFTWTTHVLGMSIEVATGASQIQVATRVSDWQLVGGVPPATLNTGPGPYVDRIRIGRGIGIGKTTSGSIGPAIDVGVDTRTQAQDAFPTVVDPSITPGEHFVPDGTNRFGTCAFSAAVDLGVNPPASPRLITADSIFLRVKDVRGVGGVTSVKFYGAITSGPHAGKSPPGTINTGPFFSVDAEPVVAANGNAIQDMWFVDLDDTYFRGGDVLKYFIAATDAGGGFSSEPSGLPFLPASVAQAEALTGGLFEVSYLPVINWAPAYLAAIAAHPTGDIAPTAPQLAASTQRNCMLYVNAFNPDRRSHATSRTSFMYTLDALGYRNSYDVYDMQGSGNINNHLGGRANVAQASGYALIVQDSGRRNVGTIPNGSDPDFKVNQAQWYRQYLAQGVTGLAATASLWLIGENIAFENAGSPLLTVDAGLANIVNDQALAISPDVLGQASNTWHTGSVTAFSGDRFSLQGGFPAIRNYDGFAATAGATLTHRYVAGPTMGTGAVVMNRNVALKWNTVVCGFPWFDIREPHMTPPSSPRPEFTLASKVLGGTLPLSCIQGLDPSDGPDTPAVPQLPTALHPNVPNPFNPTTQLTFDLAHAGRVRLNIYDAAGRVVRTLVDGGREAGRHRVLWSGVNSSDKPCASGVYFVRLEAPDAVFTRRIVLVR